MKCKVPCFRPLTYGLNDKAITDHGICFFSTSQVNYLPSALGIANDFSAHVRQTTIFRPTESDVT